MAYLSVKRIGRFRYFYILKSVRKGARVAPRILEYLGRDPDPVRLKRALRYWRVTVKPRRGGRTG